MPVMIENETDCPVDELAITAACESVLRAVSAGDAEMSVLLVDDDTIRLMNRDHRGQNLVTDVLSFPIDPEPPVADGPPWLLGDVVINLAQTERQAAEAGVDRGVELTELIVHGILHLRGYDHEADEGEMLELQDRLMVAITAIPW